MNDCEPASVNIYYFSGTGNAYTAASWVKDFAESKVSDVSINSIETIEDQKTIAPSNNSLNVFSFPTHGFAPPWIMLKFMFAFPKSNGSSVAFINTKAGTKIGKLYFPGMTGLAQWLPAFIFLIKGYKIKGLLPLDMPHSWVSFFPPNPVSCNPPMLARCRRIVDKMCERVLQGKKYYRYTVFTQLWFDISVSWIVPSYICFGRFYLAKTLYSSYKCNGCSLCAKSCPVNAIEMRNDMPYWKYTCESCMRCMNICPKRSIQSWISRAAIIFYVAGFLLISYAKTNLIFASLFLMIVFFPVYWLLIKLLYFRAFNVIFTYTSLTKYWSRYFAEGVKLKNLISNNQVKKA